MLKNFQLAEFDSPDAPGSGAMMQLAMLRKVDQLRDRIGRPLKITSGFRTLAHNAKQTSSVDGSAHCLGWAVDVAAATGRDKWDLVRLAMELGFKRIGIGRTFVHLDLDPTKPELVIWTYA